MNSIVALIRRRNRTSRNDVVSCNQKPYGPSQVGAGTCLCCRAGVLAERRLYCWWAQKHCNHTNTHSLSLSRRSAISRVRQPLPRPLALTTPSVRANSNDDPLSAFLASFCLRWWFGWHRAVTHSAAHISSPVLPLIAPSILPSLFSSFSLPPFSDSLPV